MAAPAILTQGTTITITDHTGTPVAINGHVSLNNLGGGVASIIDVTTLASTAKERRMGLQDFGSFTMELIFNPDDAGQAALTDAMDRQEQRIFVLTLPSLDPVLVLDKWTANVDVLSMPFNIAADGVVKGSVQFSVTGKPGWS